MSCGTHVNASWHTNQWVLPCHIYEWVMAYIYMSHGRIWPSHDTRTLTQTSSSAYILQILSISVYATCWCVRAMTWSYVCHDSFMCEQHCTQTSATTSTSSSVYMSQLLCAWVYATCVKKQSRFQRPLHCWIILHFKRPLHKLDVNVQRAFKTHVQNARCTY